MSCGKQYTKCKNTFKKMKFKLTTIPVCFNVSTKYCNFVSMLNALQGILLIFKK